jgi:hypothetical protein
MSQDADSKPSRWSTAFTPLVVAAAVLLGGAIFHFQSSICSPYEISRSQAPDQQHVAIVREQACGVGTLGVTYQTISVQTRQPPGKETEVFKTDLAQPILSWTDAGQLVVTVSEIGWIGVSLHRAEGVDILYQLSDRLSDEQIAQRIAARDRKKFEDYLHTPSPPPQGNFGSYVLEKKFDRENLKSFKAWAAANVSATSSH